MTTDELKDQILMDDVLSMYGLRKNRNGFCSCPFHGSDLHPSMKVYKKDFHCFTCGANGDIFSFVQRQEGCSFKEAFLKLGGTYEKKSTWQQQRFQYQLEQKKAKEQRELESKKALKRHVMKDIDLQELFIKLFPVFSDDWCEAVNQREKDRLILEELNREGVRIYD